jgi:hypothetical protein
LTAFGGAILECLASRMGGQAVGDPSLGMTLRAASGEDREWAGPRAMPETPVWISDKEGYLLNITEPSVERCEVRAYQLPVDATFQSIVEAVQATFPDFKPVSVEHGYNPIAYQLEAVRGHTRYVLHLEGAEDGTPGHALRASLLYAYVVRQSATGAPPSPPPRPPQPAWPSKPLSYKDLLANAAVATDALCFGTRAKNQVIGDWSPSERGPFHPAAAGARALSPGHDSDLPVWEADNTAGLVTVTEQSPDKCSVSAFLVPPEAAAQETILVATKLFPQLKRIPATPVNPTATAYQLEMVSNGVRYVLHLEAGKQQAAGSDHSLGFLMAFVVRQPESAPPAFR